MTFLRRFTAVAIAVLLLGGCTPDPKIQQPTVTILQPAQLSEGETISAPKSEPILTVSGKIGATNQGDALALDLETIEQLQIVEYKIFDLFENQQVTFEGVLLNDLMDLWQIQPEATFLEIKALNDYTITIPIQTTREIPILFALKQGGKYMERNYRGPAMLVVPPFENKPEIEINRQAFWIRQIESISVS